MRRIARLGCDCPWYVHVEDHANPLGAHVLLSTEGFATIDALLPSHRAVARCEPTESRGTRCHHRKALRLKVLGDHSIECTKRACGVLRVVGHSVRFRPRTEQVSS